MQSQPHRNADDSTPHDSWARQHPDHPPQHAAAGSGQVPDNQRFDWAPVENGGYQDPGVQVGTGALPAADGRAERPGMISAPGVQGAHPHGAPGVTVPIPPRPPRRQRESAAARATRVIAHLVGEVLITVGVFLLLFVVWQLWWTDIAANKTQDKLASSLQQEWKRTGPVKGDTDGPPPVEKVPPEGQAFALVHIPRFAPDYSRPIISGVGLDVLERGVGHYPDTVGPGQVGNFSIAGHRVTYGKPFNQIADLQPGDAIVIEGADAWFIYKMTTSQIVYPEQIEVVAPVPNKPGAAPTQRMITLTACHPMFSARQRFVVHGEFARWQPKSAGKPKELG